MFENLKKAKFFFKKKSLPLIVSAIKRLYQRSKTEIKFIKKATSINYNNQINQINHEKKYANI